MTEKIVSETLNTPDADFDLSLRPGQFDDFIGQTKVRERLELSVEAARGRDDVLDHMLLSGPPGLGKTTLAYLLGAAMGVNVRATSGPIIDKAADLAGLLTSLERGDILFIDEIHRLQKTVEEYLYSAMEDFMIDIMIDQGPQARSVRLNLPRFTLVGATTRSGLIAAPLRSRFGLTNRLDYYAVDELQQIVTRSAGILNVAVDDDGAHEIGRRSRGTPRVGNNLLRWVRDYAQVKADNRITGPIVEKAVAMLEIDADGLDEMDKRILDAIANRFSGGPVGVSSVAVAVGEEAGTIEEVYEPFLIQEGFVKRTPQGRVLTERGYEKLGMKPTGGQEEMF